MDLLTNHRTLLPFLVLTTTIVVNAIFGLLVLARTYRKTYGWFFAGTLFGIALWAFGDMLLLFARDINLVRFGAELFYIGPLMIPIFIWYFAISFPENRRPGPWPILSAFTAFSILSVLFIGRLGLFVKSIEITQGVNVATPQTPGYLFYAAYFSTFFMLTYAAFLLKMRSLRGVNRTQVAYTFYGALGASVPALFTNLSLPLYGVRTLLWMGPIFTLFFASSVAAAIIKHRLFDIRWYTVRSAAYLFTLFAAALLYVVPAVLATTYLLHAPLKASTVVLLAFITLLVAFLFESVKKFFNRVTDRLFYQDAYEPQVFFNRLNRTLVATVDLEGLLRQATKLIAESLNADFCLIALRGPKQDRLHPRVIGTTTKYFAEHDLDRGLQMLDKLDGHMVLADFLDAEHHELRRLMLENNVAMLAPLGKPPQELGYIVLGPKKSGNSYNGQDTRVIETVANEMVIAIQNALRFEEIERFNATLQEKIEDATKRLRRTNDKLRQLDETKDDFISMASHQLRTPLTSVKGYVSMVLDGDAGKISPLQRKLLNQAFISSQRMVYLISDLLNVSRLRTGKFIIEPVPTNLAQVVKDEVDQLVETAKGRNLELVYRKPEHFSTYMLDETKLRQVIMNFIDNAIYYTPSGGHIVVSLAEKAQAIELTVTDDGIGVPKADQHHLFSKFYRAHNARQARPDGTGLGLFMAKKVVLAQGGATIFRSQPGKGSTFGFSFAKSHLKVAK